MLAQNLVFGHGPIDEYKLRLNTPIDFADLIGLGRDVGKERRALHG